MYVTGSEPGNAAERVLACRTHRLVLGWREASGVAAARVGAVVDDGDEGREERGGGAARGAARTAKGRRRDERRKGRKNGRKYATVMKSVR